MELVWYQKLPLSIIISILLSTFLIYLISLGFGFNYGTIYFFDLIVVFAFLLLLAVRKNKYKKIDKVNACSFFVGALVYLLFFLSLFPGIFTKYNGYYVLSSVNWQDTSMHLEIIESLTQGNFPPQAPYFSGRPLSYYYFSDLHSAVLEKSYGNFLPFVLVLVNPIYASVIVLGLYSISYFLFKRIKISILISFIGIFSANFLYINFFKDLFVNLSGGNFIYRVFDLISNSSYSLEYGKLIEFPSLVDQLLQNRPMMAGMSAFVVSLMVSLIFLREKKIKYIFLIAFIGGLTFKFQAFSSICIFAIGILSILVNLKTKFLLNIFIFLLTIFILVFSVEFLLPTSGDAIKIAQKSIIFKPWKSETLFYYPVYYFLNFGFPFILAILGIFCGIYKKFNKEVIFLSILFFSFLAIPHLVTLTPIPFDMVKFFWYMQVVGAILIGYIINKFSSKLVFGLIVVIAFVSSFNSFLTLGSSILNKNMAYEQSDYDAGIWIRNNTSERSVFVAIPTVHTPISQIGGRLRLLSYINWPYSHGFNVGQDSVFTRQSDINEFYENPSVNLNKIVQKYKANYVYYGEEESNNYPRAIDQLNSMSRLKLVYESKEIKIFRII